MCGRALPGWAPTLASTTLPSLRTLLLYKTRRVEDHCHPCPRCGVAACAQGWGHDAIFVDLPAAYAARQDGRRVGVHSPYRDVDESPPPWRLRYGLSLEYEEM